MESINSLSRDNLRVVDKVIETNTGLRNAKLSEDTPEIVALAHAASAIARKKVECPKRQLKLIHRATRNI